MKKRERRKKARKERIRREKEAYEKAREIEHQKWLATPLTDADFQRACLKFRNMRIRNFHFGFIPYGPRFVAKDPEELAEKASAWLIEVTKGLPEN